MVEWSVSNWLAASAQMKLPNVVKEMSALSFQSRAQLPSNIKFSSTRSKALDGDADSEKFPDPFTPQHYKGLHLKLLILSGRFGIDFLLRYTVLELGPWVKFGFQPIFVNEVLLEYSYTHLITSHLWLLSSYNGGGKVPETNHVHTDSK